jgi:hypothetical protein
MKNQKIAYLNEWINATIDNCEFISPNIWIKDKWKNLKVKNSKIIIKETKCIKNAFNNKKNKKFFIKFLELKPNIMWIWLNFNAIIEYFKNKK